MLNLPQPKLGHVTTITITTPDLDKSFAFYTKLGFNEVGRYDFPFPWIQISDGALLIMLRKDTTPAISLTYYVKDMDSVVTEVENTGITFAEKKNMGGIMRNVAVSPDGLKIALVTHVDGFNQPSGPTMLKMPHQDYFNPAKYPNATIGMFGEFAHPVQNLDTAIAFFEKLGFAKLYVNESPYRWAILSDGLAVIGAHQTTNFTDPTITYFASDMKEKIAALKAKGGLDIHKDMGESNTVLNTPEGQKFNLFKLGM
ncbi:MAG TPA: VOC family protein [Flavobacteriales bacterium]|nr:VOC family protein [Flavobacteriales bacterium]